MRVLHTSDWHLGHRLYDRDQQAEQQLALNWLLETIEDQKVDLLIVAGDVFDTSNPPNYARRQYYNFLGKLRNTGCRHVVIVGGNHDSPAMLNATSEVLRYIDIVVIGAATESIHQQVIELKDHTGKLEAVVAAVPFLRDRDIHYNQAGEDEESRTHRLRQAIRDHYQQLGQLVEQYRTAGVPLITTGHLYAHGAEASEKRTKIYIGNRSNILATDFPAVFDYVALGHIHRAQIVGSLQQVRYSGSLLPLDFSEVADDKIVYLLDFLTNEVAMPKSKGNKQASSTSSKKTSLDYKVEAIAVPTFRRLKRIDGTLDEVKEKLDRFLAKRALEDGPEETLAPWLEIKVNTDGPILRLHEQLRALIGDRPAELLSTQLVRQSKKNNDTQRILPRLDELSIEEVFEKLCQDNHGETPDNYPELLTAFRELENWRQEKEVI